MLNCVQLCNYVDCILPGSSVHGVSRQEYWSELPFPSPGDLPNWENPGCLHCRWILYHLSYQRSPKQEELMCVLGMYILSKAFSHCMSDPVLSYIFMHCIL